MQKFALFLLGCLSASALYAQSVRFDPTTLFIKLRPGHSLPSHQLIKSSKHLFEQVYQLDTEDAVALENDLRHDPSLVWAEKSFYAGKRELALPGTTPKSFGTLEGFNDPAADKVWAFKDASKNGVSVVNAYRALPNRASETVIVAVVDTGVDYNHEELKDVMWVNAGEIPGNGIDDDGNGYIDDIHGINTRVRDANGVATGDPVPEHPHGTHVSGTIAAKQNNGIGIAGIAANARIMAIRTVPADADETDKDVVESFLYAAHHGAKLINCSFGKPVNEGGKIVSEAIKHIGEKHGVLVVAAAGNDSWGPWQWFNIDNNLRYPASYDNEHLLVIAATTAGGGLASFSNVGKVNVDVAAPGENVYSTIPGNGYASYSGTSMATPTTVGVAAQILSYYPKLTPLELKDVVMKSVTPVAAFTEKMVTGGRIDLAEGLKYAEANYAHRAGH